MLHRLSPSGEGAATWERQRTHLWGNFCDAGISGGGRVGLVWVHTAALCVCARSLQTHRFGPADRGATDGFGLFGAVSAFLLWKGKQAATAWRTVALLRFLFHSHSHSFRLLTGRKIYTEKDALEVSRQRVWPLFVHSCLQCCSAAVCLQPWSHFGLCPFHVFIIKDCTLQAQEISCFSVRILQKLPRGSPDKGITVVMSTSLWTCFLQWRRSGSSTHSKYPDTASSVDIIGLGWKPQGTTGFKNLSGALLSAFSNAECENSFSSFSQINPQHWQLLSLPYRPDRWPANILNRGRKICPFTQSEENKKL